MRTIKNSLAAFIGFALANFTAHLPAQAPSDQPLPALVRSARNAFRPINQSDVNHRRAELTTAVSQLDRYLATGGANGNNWKRFLRWDEMRTELTRGPKSDIDVLDEIQSLYTSGHDGFELPIYADVGKALRRYIDALDTFRNPEARGHYEARIDALASDIEAYLQQPGVADTHRAGMILGELAASNQAPRVIEAVRRKMSHPNLLIEAGEQFVAAGIADPVNDSGTVTDVILGTRIRGTVQTVGYVGAELGNSPNYASIDVLMQGTAYSRTVGYNGPAIIHSNGVTGLGGRKRLILDQYGMRAFPAASNARTRTTVTGIAVTSRFLPGLVQKIANKQVYQGKSQAEAIAGRRAEARLNSRMDAQSLNLIADANRNFWNKFRNPLLRVGAFPEQIKFSSSGDRLRIQATRADAYQLGAPLTAPQSPAADVAVRLHQSIVNNFGATVLAGRTVTRNEMNRLMKTLTGKIPEELQDEEERDWSITFAVERPLELAIDEGGLRMTIRGDEYTTGDNAYPAMNVTARYRLEKNDRGGLRALRQGELEIYPPDFKPGEDQLSSSQQSLKTILERRFGKLFKPELPDKPTAGLEPGGRWKVLGPLPLVAMSADEGWLALGWRRQNPPPANRLAASGGSTTVAARPAGTR